MARKAGPGNGAEDAPEGHADVSPEESVVLPDARLAEDPEGRAAPRLAGAGEEPRVEDLSEEGLGAVPSDEALRTGGMLPPESLGTLPQPEPPVSAAVEEWQVAPPSGAAPDLGTSDPEAPGRDLPEGTGPAPEPWRSGSARDRDDPGSERPDPLLLTTPAASAENRTRPLEPPAAPASAAASLPPVASPPPRRRGGFGALLLGGMIAAALGFGAAWLAQERLGLFPARLPADLEERLAALEARPVPEAGDVQALADRLAEAETRLAALEEAPVPSAEPAAVDLEPLRQEIAQGLSEAQARAAELQERIAALEARPAAPTGEAAPLGSLAPEAGPALRAAPAVDPDALREDILAALEPRLAETEAGLAEVQAALSETQVALDALSARLDEAEAQGAAAAEEARAAAASLAEAETRAATAEAQARARAALGALEAALEAGAPFEAPLSELQATGAAVPDALAPLAAEGAPTLADLRESFPEAARAGLAAARDQGVLDDGGGVMGFLRGQLSVRSVAPREGEDPDAVLSRAEAQLDAGQLEAALAEIGSLPEPVRAAMADWIAQAETRARADAALAGLRDALPAPDASPAD